jgi:ABC-type multidrug transport system fused ATPase/permease subunit
VIDQGKIVESGTHEQLMKQKSAYYHLVNVQKGGI